MAESKKGENRFKVSQTKLVRGPYLGSKKKYKVERPTSYFKSEHEGYGRVISWTDVADRGNAKIYVQYKFSDDERQYRTPRSKTAWLDSIGLERAKVEIQRWKDENNNSIGIGELLPEFYLKHRKEYLRWLNKTARSSTIQNYERNIEIHVFPFLVGKLKLSEPKEWDQTSIQQWQVFLMEHVHEGASRNRIKTAFRRYLRFLMLKGLISSLPTIINEPEERDTKETPIPGELPDWRAVVEHFRSLPPGKLRFVKAVEAAFGVRVSEAMAVTETDFFGEESEQFINDKNDSVRKVKERGLAALFLAVDSANKRKVNKDIVRLLGGDDDRRDPKSGRYTACCTSFEMAELIVEMVENREHLGDVRYDDVYKFREHIPHDHSPFKFHEYRDHDYRRLNITLQTLDLDIDGKIEICCEFHGQSNFDTFKRYFQWGLAQRRRQGRSPETKLKVFKTKNSMSG